MIAKEELFLYEYIKLCNDYFISRNKQLLIEISDMHKRDLNVQSFIFNSLQKETRCYSGRISLESAEDISDLEVGDTFSFSKSVDVPIRVWCKDKDKLQKHIQHKLYSKPGATAVLLTERINSKHILFDFDGYNTMVESGGICEAFSGTLKTEAKGFKPLNIKDTIKEVLVCSSANRAEVIDVIKPFENTNTKLMATEIRKSLGY